MAPIPLTPPSSGSEKGSPLASRRAAVSKKILPIRLSTSSKPTSPKFTWKAHHRRTLLVCHNMKLQATDLVRVFNTLYREDCTTAGYQDGVKRGLLQAQWQEHRKSTCKSWQTVLASSETELELAKREIEDCLTKDPTQIKTPSLSKVPRNSRIFDKQSAPFSSNTPLSSNAGSINVAAKSSGTSSATTRPASRVQRSAVQTRVPPRQLVSVVIETQKQVSVTKPTRNIFKQSPRSLVSAGRTRTIGGEQVPIIRATDQDLDVKHPVTRAEAHSAVPELLFRFYDDHSQGVRTADGEICGRYAYLPCKPPAPPPCDDDRMFAAVLSHLNTDETASELISTTSNLFFAMRLAAKSNANSRIYVICGSTMLSEKIFHLWPYHLRFKAERLYYNGKYMNPSSHEYAIWATIPRQAIIYDFAFADLERHLIGNPQMLSLFRIDEMRTKKGNTHIRRDFRKDDLELTLAMVDGIARLMPSFGIVVTSPSAVIARLVSELIRGFEMNLPRTTATQWDILGGAFAYALAYHGKQTNVAESHLARTKEAFLSGARIGLGELNWHLNPQKQARMVKKGVLLGLGVGVESIIDPARLEATKNFQKAIARFAYKGDQAERNDMMMMDEDDTLVDDTTDDNKDPLEDEDENTLVEDDEEAETEIEEHIAIEKPRSQRRRTSYPREATPQSPKKANETFIIYDRSDDEDYVEESDMEY